MSIPHDDYKQLPIPEKANLDPCPVCAAEPEIWQYSTSDDGPTSKAVMCSNGTRFGPQDGAVDEGCLLYMPPQSFYRSRIVEAIKYWNDYAKALVAQQRGRRWKRAKVLRNKP